MDTVSDFYDSLDLKYPEIGIAMEAIDRTNPGKVKFIIPILTPNLDTTKLTEQTVYQDSSNLKNDSSTLEVDNISITNYIEINIPKELCTFTGGELDILEGSYITVSGSNASISGSTEVSGSGDIKSDSITTGMTLGLRDTDSSYTNTYSVQSCTAGSSDGTISITGSASIKGNISFTNASVVGRLVTMPVDRYIEAGSKWIVVFIGGDITKPKIIARYSDDE